MEITGKCCPEKQSSGTVAQVTFTTLALSCCLSKCMHYISTCHICHYMLEVSLNVTHTHTQRHDNCSNMLVQALMAVK